jgi:hypothetical protein
MKKDNSVIWLTLGLLGVSLSVLFLGGNMQKPSTTEINYCTEGSQSKGVVRGIVTDISRQPDGNLLVSLTSGTEGCSIVASSRRKYFNYIKIGDRVKFQASQSGDFLTVESTPEIDPSVVDNNGKIGETKSVEVIWRKLPRFFNNESSTLIYLGNQRVEITKLQANQIQLGKKAVVTYYVDNEKIADIKPLD